jgi:hypothetical protein
MKDIQLIINVLRDNGEWDEEISTAEKKFPGHTARLILDTSVLKELDPKSRRLLKIENINSRFTVHSDKLVIMMFTHKGMCFKTGAEMLNNSITFKREKAEFCGVKSTLDCFALDMIYTPNSMSKY